MVLGENHLGFFVGHFFPNKVRHFFTVFTVVIGAKNHIIDDKTYNALGVADREVLVIFTLNSVEVIIFAILFNFINNNFG
jgi:hypothetical protein